MKKFLAIISALALVIGCLSVMAAAAELPAPLTGEYELIKKVSNVMAWEGGPLQDMEKFIQGSDLKPADGNQYLEFVVEAREGDPSKGLFKCSPNDWSWNPEIEVVKGDATKTGIYTIMVPVAEFTKALTDAGLTLSSTMVHHGGGIATFLEARLYTYTPAETDDTEEPEKSYKYTGWFVTGPETHAMRIGRAIITLPHEYDEDGDCIFCRHHVETEAEEVEITE